MQCFLVAIPPGSSIKASSIGETFPEHHQILPGLVWAVAGDQRTCVDVCEALGIGSNGLETLGVVVRMAEYNGFADRALWEKLNAWETQ